MPKKIKILFTISNFNTAGSGKVLYDLVNGVDKERFDVEIACGSREGAFFNEVEKLGVPIHIFETKTPYRPYWSLLYRIIKISKFYKKQGYHVIHSWQWSSDWTEVLAARLVRVKWLYTKKAMGFNSKHWKIKSYLANFIITINEDMYNYFPYKKAQALIPLGIDTQYYSPEKRQHDPNCFNIITVANLVPVKGIEILIQAVFNLKDTQLKLIVLGDYDSSYGERMLILCEQLGLRNQVEFVEKQLDVRPFLKSSDLFVIPTLDEGRREGMPMALVEAMCMAVPVIGSNVSGINYVLKDFNELLFKAGDVEDLSLKIKTMKSVGRDERIILGQKLRQYCQDNFMMDTFIRTHEALYEKLKNNE